MRRRWGRLPTLLALVVALVALSSGIGPAGGHADVVEYRRPVPGEVLRGFEPPGSAYGPGHRGVDLATATGEVVRAAADGQVAHAGPVAGIVWVSVDHDDGVRTTYGPLTRVAVGRGEQVAGGQRLGVLAPGGHGHGGGDAGLHLSARRHGAYLDPLTLFTSSMRPSLVARDRADATGDRAGARAASRPAGRQTGPPMGQAVPGPLERRSTPGPPTLASAQEPSTSPTVGATGR